MKDRVYKKLKKHNFLLHTHTLKYSVIISALKEAQEGLAIMASMYRELNIAGVFDDIHGVDIDRHLAFNESLANAVVGLMNIKQRYMETQSRRIDVM